MIEHILLNGINIAELLLHHRGVVCKAVLMTFSRFGL